MSRSEPRGALSDWTTQRWVEFTGRRVDLDENPWLAGLVAPPSGTGADFVERTAREHQLEVRRAPEQGLLTNFAALAGPNFDPQAVHPSVRHFYEQTGSFSMDAWAEWNGVFRPFGVLLASLFSRRLQQLNVPISALDTSRGISSEIVQLVDRETEETRFTLWMRQLVGTGNILYAGSYSSCRVPGWDGVCVKVVFPLPNGNAIVVMKPVAHPDGSLTVASEGRGFGDPGFYFTVRTPRGVFARYLRALKESIHVYRPPDGDEIRADHRLRLWGATFLRLHYRLQRKRAVSAQP